MNQPEAKNPNLRSWEELETDEERIERIDESLTKEEYEWFSMREWSSGVAIGRKDALAEVLALLLKEAGEMYADGNDVAAELNREIARWLKEKMNP